MAHLLRKKLALLALVLYWPSLFILAHIPIPKLVRQADLSDKTLHFLAYFILVFLLWGTIRPYERVNWRKAPVWVILAVVVWYGVLDEWTQGYAGRTPDVKDFAADLIGAGASLLLLTFLSSWPCALLLTGMSIFILANCSRADVTKLLPLTHGTFHLLAYSAFTCLWVIYIRRICRRFSSPGAKGLECWLGKSRHPILGVMLYVLMPCILLANVKLGSIVLHRPFVKSDVLTGLCGIIGVSCLALFIDARGRRTKSTEQETTMGPKFKPGRSF